MEKLKPEAEYTVPGAPDWIAFDGAIYVSNKPKNSIAKLDLKSTKVEEIAGFHKPCSGLAVGFGSLWVPNCGDQTLARVDLKTSQITATIQTGVADSEGGIAVGTDSVWILSKPNSTLARIDPGNNKIVTEIELPTGCYAAAFGMGAVWVTCTEQDQVLRVDPNTNLITNRIKVGPKPRFLTVGEGGVWTLNQGDGKVSRIDPQSNKVVATIDVGVPGPGGDISAGEGSVWVTSFGYPLSRIDPDSNSVAQQFVGAGGDAVRAGKGFVWLCDLRGGKVWRLDPKLIAATLAE
jgi:YVTN family beta-propeller protein